MGKIIEKIIDGFFGLMEQKEKNRHVEKMAMLMKTQEKIGNQQKAQYIRNDLSEKANNIKFFISHDSRYEEQKNELSKALSDNGFQVWQDKPNNSEELREFLDNGFRDSSHIIIYVYKPEIFGRTDGGFPIEIEIIHKYLQKVQEHPKGSKPVFIFYYCGDNDKSVKEYLKENKKIPRETKASVEFILEHKTNAFFNNDIEGFLNNLKK